MDKIQVFNKHNFLIASLADKERYGCNASSHLHVVSDKTEATNGHYLMQVTSVPVTTDDLPVNGNKPVTKSVNGLISREAALKIEKAIPKNSPTMPILHNVWVTDDNDENLDFTCTDMEIWNTIKARKADMKFPSTDKIMPKETAQIEIGFNPEYMMKLCQQLVKMDCKGVKLSLYGDDKAMKIEGTTTDTGQTATILLMPVKL